MVDITIDEVDFNGLRNRKLFTVPAILHADAQDEIKKGVFEELSKQVARENPLKYKSISSTTITAIFSKRQPMSLRTALVAVRTFRLYKRQVDKEEAVINDSNVVGFLLVANGLSALLPQLDLPALASASSINEKLLGEFVGGARMSGYIASRVYAALPAAIRNKTPRQKLFTGSKDAGKQAVPEGHWDRINNLLQEAPDDWREWRAPSP